MSVELPPEDSALKTVSPSFSPEKNVQEDRKANDRVQKKGKVETVEQKEREKAEEAMDRALQALDAHEHQEKTIEQMRKILRFLNGSLHDSRTDLVTIAEFQSEIDVMNSLLKKNNLKAIDLWVKINNMPQAPRSIKLLFPIPGGKTTEYFRNNKSYKQNVFENQTQNGLMWAKQSMHVQIDDNGFSIKEGEVDEARLDSLVFYLQSGGNKEQIKHFLGKMDGSSESTEQYWMENFIQRVKKYGYNVYAFDGNYDPEKGSLKRELFIDVHTENVQSEGMRYININLTGEKRGREIMFKPRARVTNTQPWPGSILR